MDQTTSITPVADSERIASLDIIRGVAILFILFLNIPGMGSFERILQDPRYPSWTTADWWTTLVVQTALYGTQRGLLELLFGAGIIIMARRAMSPDGPVVVADLHYRRNLLLILLGLFNAFVLMWWGDILLLYGIVAVFLFAFRQWSAKAQLGLAGLVFASLLWFSVIGHQQANRDLSRVNAIATASAAGKPVSAEDKKLLEQHRDRVERRRLLPADNPKLKSKIADGVKAHHSTFEAYWKAQAEGWRYVMSWFWAIEGEVAGTMLVGMALTQMGVLQGRARTATYAAMVILGYGFGGYARATGALGFLAGDLAPGWQRVVADLSRLAVTLGHLGLVHLALRSAAGRALLRPFAAAGKIPLTIYLGTSLLMMWVVFAPWGLGLWGRFGAADLAGIAAIVIALELIAANLWVRRFANGPMEWLWKSLAYQQRQPFRRPRVAAGGASPLPAE